MNLLQVDVKTLRKERKKWIKKELIWFCSHDRDYNKALNL